MAACGEASASRFHTLLQLLSDEHDREVQSLCNRIEAEDPTTLRRRIEREEEGAQAELPWSTRDSDGGLDTENVHDFCMPAVCMRRPDKPPPRSSLSAKSQKQAGTPFGPRRSLGPDTSEPEGWMSSKFEDLDAAETAEAVVKTAPGSVETEEVGNSASSTGLPVAPRSARVEDEGDDMPPPPSGEPQKLVNILPAEPSLGEDESAEDRQGSKERRQRSNESTAGKPSSQAVAAGRSSHFLSAPASFVQGISRRISSARFSSIAPAQHADGDDDDESRHDRRSRLGSKGIGLPSLPGKSRRSTESAKQAKKKQSISWDVSVADEEENEDADEEKCSTVYKVRPRWSTEEKTRLARPDEKKAGGKPSLARSPTQQFRQQQEQKDNSRRGALSATTMSSGLDLEEDENPRASCLDRYVGLPHGRFNFTWDLASMFFITYDCVMIPFDVFSPEDTPVTTFLGWMTAAFWTSDVLHTFLTGYYNKGDVVMVFRDIARNYITSWFIPDTAIINFDWIYLITKQLDTPTSTAGLRHVKTLRSLRGLRLLRGVKMGRIIKSCEDRITSEHRSIIFNVLKLFGGLVLLNHVIACTWYGIGRQCQDRDIPNWVDQYIKPSDTIWYRYTTSFHWALTQFTPASINVQPHNVWERTFGVIVLLFALISVSSFVSGITNAVMLLRTLGGTKSKQFWLLRRFLRECEVHEELSLHIQRYCEFAWQSQQSKLQEKSVQVLNLLSPTLRADLNTAIYEPYLSSHPLFVLFNKVAFEAFRRLCNTALSRQHLVRGDVVFSPGEEANSCYIMGSGECLYLLENDEGNSQQEQVAKFTWICECALWTLWHSVGTLTVKKETLLVKVEADKFASAVHSDPSCQREAAAYARGFTNGLNRGVKTVSTDLWQSSLIEGLWFRLFNEFNVRRVEGGRISTSVAMQRSSVMSSL